MRPSDSDRHRQLGEVLLVVANRVHVEQTLRRMRMAAVAGIDHADVALAGIGQMFRDQMGRSA